ncbi:hypothetical protein [Staphylococcus aureus]|uniref:hypothetical protein n=1 Tax=Staphylococcus aureus TaxID=1280 RepID=UPI003F6A22E0
MNSAKLIDHTLLKPESTRTQIDQIIDEAKAYNLLKLQQVLQVAVRLQKTLN